MIDFRFFLGDDFNVLKIVKIVGRCEDDALIILKGCYFFH